MFDPATGVLAIDATSGANGALAVEGESVEGFRPGVRTRKELKLR